MYARDRPGLRRGRAGPAAAGARGRRGPGALCPLGRVHPSHCGPENTSKTA